MTSEPQSSSAIPSDQRSRFAAAYGVLTDAISARAFPGCAFGVLAGGEVVLQDALGRFTYDPSDQPVSAHTIYDVASLTKVVATTAAAMLLWQRGLLDLEMPLGELLPGFMVGRPPGTYARYVKVRHLLAHNSGLPGYVEFFRTLDTPAAIFRACLELRLQAPPGDRAEYSDPGFILLGKALEVITREPLPGWMRREVFHPLGMSATGFTPPARARNAIPPTEEDAVLRHRIVQGEVQDENAFVLGGGAGHAGLFSNVADLLRFSHEILQAPHETSGIDSMMPGLFESATVDLFAERQAPEGSSRALGWDTPSVDSSSGRYFSARSIGHLGYSGCSLWIDLDAKIAVALLTNRTWPDRQSQLIRAVRPAFHNAVMEVFPRWSPGGQNNEQV